MSQSILTLAKYLEAIGVDHKTPKEVLEFHKKEHKKLYHREYAKQRRKEKVRLENILSKAEYRKLKRYAKRYRQQKLNRFLLQCAFAYLENETVDHDPELTRELKQQIRAIGNNVNQVVHQLHRVKDYQNKNLYLQMKHQIKKLEETVDGFIKKPPNLKIQLEILFEQVPESIEDFEKFLTKIKTKYGQNDSEKYESKG